MTFRVRTALVVLLLTAVTMGGAFAGVWQRFVSAQRHQLDNALLAVARREAAEAASGQSEFTDAPGPSANAVGPLPKFGVLYGIGRGRTRPDEQFHDAAADAGAETVRLWIRLRA